MNGKDEQTAIPEPREDASETATLLKRQDKMLKQILQTHSALQEMLQGIPAELSRLHASFAMLARQVASNDVKLDTSLETFRGQLNSQIERLQASLASDILDRAVERVFLSAASPSLDDIEVILRNPEASTADALDALRMVRGKLVAGFAPLGVELIPVCPGKTEFDETLHECVQIASPEDPLAQNLESGTIVRLYRNGFTLKGQVIRRASVTVKGA